MYFVSIDDLCATARTPVAFLNMSKLKTKDILDCYGERNLVPIDLPKHIIFHTSNSMQPVFTCESEKEDKKGRLVYWFFKSETQRVYKNLSKKGEATGHTVQGLLLFDRHFKG